MGIFPVNFPFNQSMEAVSLAFLRQTLWKAWPTWNARRAATWSPWI